jgi:hypothetical protein
LLVPNRRGRPHFIRIIRVFRDTRVIRATRVTRSRSLRRNTRTLPYPTQVKAGFLPRGESVAIPAPIDSARSTRTSHILRNVVLEAPPRSKRANQFPRECRAIAPVDPISTGPIVSRRAPTVLPSPPSCLRLQGDLKNTRYRLFSKPSDKPGSLHVSSSKNKTARAESARFIDQLGSQGNHCAMPLRNDRRSSPKSSP